MSEKYPLAPPWIDQMMKRNPILQGEAQSGVSIPRSGLSKSEELSEAEAIEAMLDHVQGEYPNLTRDELRELFHSTVDRVVEEIEK